MALRGRKLPAFIFVGITATFSTISFQTVTQSRFLTPNILGMGSLHAFVQVVLLFLLGGTQALGQVNLGSFLMNVFLMVFLSAGLSYFLLRKNQSDSFLLLMIGMILGIFFSSISMFLQMIMSPSEYDLLQGKLFVSFGNVNSQYLVFVDVAVLMTYGIPWRESHRLDALHLGDRQAQNLGVTVDQFQSVLLCLISSLVGLSTALMRLITFLGFIVANISRQSMKTYRHRELFMVGSLIVVFLLVLGQLMVEQVFHLNTPLSVVIQFVEGVYFV